MKLFLIPIHRITKMQLTYDDPIRFKAINPICSESNATSDQDYNTWKSFQFIHTRLEVEYNLLKVNIKNETLPSLNIEINEELFTYAGKMKNSSSHISLTKNIQAFKPNEIDSLLKKLLYHIRWIGFQILRNIKKHNPNDLHLRFKKLIDFSEIIPLTSRYIKSPYIKLDYLFSILCHSHEILFREFMTYVYKDKKV